MTSVVSEEVLTRKSTAQDDRMKGTPPNPSQWGKPLDGIFNIVLTKGKSYGQIFTFENK
jgi:hypothetical protein